MFVTVLSTWKEQKAQMIKSLLEDHGIDCYLSSHVSRSVHPIPVDGLGEIKVMVPELKKEDARDLIETFFPGTKE